MKLINLQDCIFGQLVVLERVESKTKATKWLCRCSCGKQSIKSGSNLTSGHTKSCGCLKHKGLNASHGSARDREMSGAYVSWQGMKQRCLNRKNPNYPNYGGRGIKVCERWSVSFLDFLRDMGERPEGSYTLERIDNNGDYCPENCKWISKSKQVSNRRPYSEWNTQQKKKQLLSKEGGDED